MARGSSAPDQRLRELAVMVEQALAATLPEVAGEVAGDDAGERCAASELIAAMRYSLCAPGKRLRPLLLLASAEAVGRDGGTLARFAAGIELIHAYSLVHDDLPAMDDDDLRRGRATNHVVYGEGLAILAGDGLLTEAMVVMLEPVAEPGLQMGVVAEIARAAGYRGMVGGQADDLKAEGAEPEEDLLRSIHARKTGALISAAVRAGALLGGATGKQIEELQEFAEHFGLAFQIADDIKDEVAPSGVSGKNPGGDRQAGKMTYPALLGIDGSRQRLSEHIELATAALAGFEDRAAVLSLLARRSLAPALRCEEL